MSDTTKIAINGQRFVDRSIARQDANPRGAFRLPEVVSAADLADVRRTLELLTFIRVAGPNFGMSVREAQDVSDAIDVLAAVIGQLTDPELNWVEETEETSCQ